MAQYHTTKGRNPRLGNSLISLGPHGGIFYKNVGTKDNYRIYKQYKLSETPNYTWNSLKIRTYYYHEYNSQR
ncbi:hypothetical protein ACLUW2_09245 [Limosilactobacillus balticus]|uniref:hypothetical protein n=1 Tax=Limosilactobacillus balticus TaxID=2759747 RepID=UPI003996C3AD